jgi:cation diffusion facilitator CzcD-associated flavoprotein CzcO
MVTHRETYPEFLPKDKVADFLEAYAVGQDIHVWLSSTVLPVPVYDPSTGRWAVEVDRAGNRVKLNPKHIVMATGNGKANIPKWPGMDSFLGPLYHSDDHKGAAPFKGKKVIVIGAVNASFSAPFTSLTPCNLVQRRRRYMPGFRSQGCYRGPCRLLHDR